MIKVNINVETKKECVQSTLWSIRQIAPNPDFEASCGTFRWRNAGNLFPQWRPIDMEKPSIGTNYICDLLRDDKEEHDIESRCSHAGYVEDVKTGVANPGFITLRGESLGEMSIWFEGNIQYPSINVRGYGNSATDGERKFVRQNIVPYLIAHIEKNKAALKSDAIRELRLNVQNRLAEARKRLLQLDDEITKAIDIAADNKDR